MHKVHFIVQ